MKHPTDDRPLAIDLFTGLHGWAEGLVEEGFDVIGFDIENMCAQFGQPRGPHIQLVIQNVLTIHGKQFKDAALIVASPPCQAYSYRAMPWKRAKALPPPDNSLFDACFRIQREASEAAGRHIPMVVENVCGAQKWVGRARWHYGSFYLWGDVPALMPMITKRNAKVGGQYRNNFKKSGAVSPAWNDTAVKNTGGSWFAVAHNTTSGHGNNPDGRDGVKNGGRLFPNEAADLRDDIKVGGDWFSDPQSPSRTSGSKSTKRKMASAMIAKIPLPLSRHIARVYKPVTP